MDAFSPGRADAPSLWQAVTPAGPELPALAGGLSCDVAVIGAGFTGLSCALHLAEAGVDVAVVEAASPGWGASGRNNGQVIPTLSRIDPDDLLARHAEAGARLVLLIRDSADLLFDLVRRHAIAAEAEQTGWVQPAHSPGRMRLAERRVAQWARVGAPVELLSRARMRELLGSEAWFGGWINRSGGHINPLALARGLARAVLAAGGRVFADSPVAEFARRDGRWELRTAAGRLTARALVLATHAYTESFAPALAPALAREIVPVLSWQMATAPFAATVRAAVIPGRQAMSDTRAELFFARWDARHRLVTGGAVIGTHDAAARLRRHVGARLRAAFPPLGEVRFDYVWNGYVAMTPDFLPRIHRLGPDAWAWTGCNGRGVALAVALGREIARAVSGADPAALALPLSEPRPLPLQPLLRRLAPLMLLRYRRRDRAELA